MHEGHHTDAHYADADHRWLAATWPFVRANLPPPPGRVLELGCGPLGGYVPELRDAGYDAIGIDPEAPDGAHYERVEFEHFAPIQPADAIVAATSLHHVTDLDLVVNLIAQRLDPGGIVVVLEWALERFDETTARWCFERLPEEPGWLHRHRDDWIASGQTWAAYVEGWTQAHQLHTGQSVVDALAARFERKLVGLSPYFFPNLAGVTMADEQAAIDAGRISPNGIRYVGRLSR
jgi:SAM-dependent methyltransferase